MTAHSPNPVAAQLPGGPRRPGLPCLRRAARCLGGLLLALCAVFCGLLWLPMAPLVVKGGAPTAEQAAMLAARPLHEVRVVSHGWHTGVVVRAQDLYAYVPALRSRFPAANWLELGWGDGGFYQAEAITTAITLDALFWPDPAVMHVVGFAESPERYFAASERRSLQLAAPAHHGLLSYLASSFARGPGGALAPQRPGLYGDSQFYAGVGLYTAVNTCNKWTAKALASAGLSLPVAPTLTAGQVMRALPTAPRAAASSAQGAPRPAVALPASKASSP